MLGPANLILSIEERWRVHANYCLKEDFLFTRHPDGWPRMP